MDEKTTNPSRTRTDAKPATALLCAATLFKNRREVAIEHNGEVYRLRITRNEKLILTK